MRRKTSLSSLALLLFSCIPPLFASGIQAADARAVVNSSHKGAILAMEYDESGNRLFTCGEDGTVRVWDLAARRLTRTLRVGHNPVSMIAVSPSSSQIAVLETDNVRSFSVSAWDWKTGELAFRVPLKDQPLFLRYSGMGSYVALGISQFDGLRILRASDGGAVAFHPEGFGIVSFAEISRSEKTIMTYQPGGRIAYWDLETGNLVKELKSVQMLSFARITRDRRFLVGATEREIVMVDLLSGAVKARAAFRGVQSLDVSAVGDRIATASADGTGTAFSLWSAPANTLVREEMTGIPRVYSPSLVRFADALLAADGNGEIYELAAGEGPRLVIKDEVANVTGIAIQKGVLALGDEHWIWVFQADLDAGVKTMRPSFFPNPLEASPGLEFLGDGRLLVWSRAGEKGSYGVLDLQSGSFSPGFGGFSGSLLQVFPQGDKLVTLEKSGMIRIVDLASSASRFSVWTPGMNRIAMTGANRLVGGRSASGKGGSSLFSIDTASGETVALAKRSVFIYDVAFVAAQGALYSLGVETDGGTSVIGNSGMNFEQETLVVKYAGEDLSASLSFDPDSGVLYTSLGFDRITIWDGKSASFIPAAERIPRRLAAGGGTLCSLNRDSSVTIWDTAKKRPLADIFLFPEKEWCITFPDGNFAGSEGGAARVNVVKNDVPVQNRESYRIELP